MYVDLPISGIQHNPPVYQRNPNSKLTEVICGIKTPETSEAGQPVVDQPIGGARRAMAEQQQPVDGAVEGGKTNVHVGAMAASHTQCQEARCR